MAVTSRDEILAEIRRVASGDGKPPGRDRFRAATGIKPGDWHGWYWRNWGDALRDAGLEPNKLNEATLSDDDLLRLLADLTRELGFYPTIADRDLWRRSHSNYPSAEVFERRLGRRAATLARLATYCSLSSDYEDVARIIEPVLADVEMAERTVDGDESVTGVVYLVRMDRWHKIGSTNNLVRRLGEIGPTLPADERLIHTIETDDPRGVEDYWHRRFADSPIRRSEASGRVV